MPEPKLPPLPPGFEDAVPLEAGALPPLPPGFEDAAEVPAVPAAVPGTTQIADNPLRSALLVARENNVGRPLSTLGAEGVQEIGEKAQFQGDLTTTPGLQVPVANMLTKNEDAREALYHPFDTLGQYVSAPFRLIADEAKPMLWEMAEGATFHKTGGRAGALAAAAADVPGDMVRAITGDPNMLALSALGAIAPGGAALLPHVHAAMGAYFAGEGGRGLLPYSERYNPKGTPWGFLGSEAWRQSTTDQQVDFFRGVAGNVAMLGLPAWHSYQGVQRAGIDLRPEEPMATKAPTVYSENVAETMASMLDRQPFLTEAQKRGVALPNDSLGGILTTASQPSFFLEAMERAAPPSRTADVVVQLPFERRLAPWDPKSTATSRTSLYDSGLAEAARARTMGGVAWVRKYGSGILDPLVRPDLPFASEEDGFKAINADADKQGLGGDQTAATFAMWRSFARMWEATTGLDQGHAWGRLVKENPYNQTPEKQLFQRAQAGELVATHSLRPEALDLFAQLDGEVPGLSVAVSRPDLKRERGGLPTLFGPITLILRPEAIDPSRVPDAVAYDRDWWSSTAPKMETRVGPDGETRVVFPAEGGKPERLVTREELQRHYEGVAAPGGPEVALGAGRLENLDAMRERAAEGGIIPASKVGDSHAAARAHSEIASIRIEKVAGRWLDKPSADQLVRLTQEAVAQYSEGRAISMRDMVELVKSVYPLAAEGMEPGRMPKDLRAAAEQVASRTAAILRDAHEKVRALPADYFEVKRTGAISRSDVLGMMVDASALTPGELAKAQQLADRFGWDFRSAELRPRPDRAITDPQEEMIFQFYDGFFQRDAQGKPKGLTQVFPDGRAMISLFEGADVSSLVHESAHVWRQALYAMRDLAQEWAQPHILEGLKDLETWAGVVDGKWTEAAEEKWARGVESYLRDGKAPSVRLAGLFRQFSAWLRKVYDDSAAAGLAKFSPEVERFFDTYVLDEPYVPEKELSWNRLRRMAEEERTTYEAALALRDLPRARKKLEDHLSYFNDWIALARGERAQLGALDEQTRTNRAGFLNVNASTEAGFAAMGRARELAEKIEQTVSGDKAKPVDVPRLMSDPLALEAWKDDLRARVREAGFGKPYAIRIGNLISFFEGESRRFREQADTAADIGEVLQSNQAAFAETQKGLVRTRAQVRLLLREMRKATGEVLPDYAKERAEVLRLADRFYASPRLLSELVDRTLRPRIAQISRAILEAEATYRAKTLAIASRGNPGETWGGDPFGDAARIELVEKIRQDVAAARRDLGMMDAAEVAAEGTGISPADILTDLSAELQKAVALEGTTRASDYSIVEEETHRLFMGGLDATMEAALKDKTPVYERFFKALWPAMKDLRELYRRTLDPMSKLNPEVYNPHRLINRVLRVFGLEEKKPVELTNEEMLTLQQAFKNAESEVSYYDSEISPTFIKAVTSLFPDIRDRQMMTLVRDTGRLNLRGLEEKYRAKAAEALSALQAAEAAGDRDGIDLAKQKRAIALRRLARAEGHVGVNGAGLSPRMGATLMQVGAALDALQNLGARAGLWSPEAFHENYLPRIYRNKDLARAMNYVRESNLLGGSNKHGFQRVFDSMIEAYIIEGLSPATLDLATLVDQYGRSVTETISKRRLLNELTSVAPDLVQWVDRNRTSAPEKFMDISRWVSEAVAPGRPGPDARLYAHEVIGTLLKNMSEPSVFDSVKGLSWVKTANHTIKRINLAIDLYHLWQVTRVAVGSGVYGPAKEGFLPFWSLVKELGLHDPNGPSHPMVREFIENGLDIGSGDWARKEMYDYLGKEVSKHLRTDVKLWNLLGDAFASTGHFMWNAYVPALKVLAMNRAVERLIENPGTVGLSRAAILRAAAEVTNDKFGSASWALKGRSKTVSDVLGLALLAPQWLESRFRNVLGVVKPGATGALWRDYWFGEGPMDVVRGTKAPLSEVPKRWATGYVVQGMMMAALGNALVSAMWPEGDEKRKQEATRGWNWFTRTVIPAQDKRGFPLEVSPFSTMDYFTAFLDDLNSQAPLLRWYRGRMGPLARGLTEFLGGTDYAGRPTREKFVSGETVLGLVDLLLPWKNNILAGSIGNWATADETSYEGWRTLARLTGGHTASSWLPGVQESETFLLQQARQWNRNAEKEWAKWYYKLPGGGEILRQIARARAQRHNARVNEFIAEIRKDPRMQATLGSFEERMKQAYMKVPE